MNKIPEWLASAEDKPLTASSRSRIENLLPTMIIGAGPTARVILEHIASRLKLLSVNSEISLLALDVIPTSVQTSVTRGSLRSDQVLCLPVDLNSLEKNIFSPAFRHVRWWWRGNSQESYGRAVGRLGIVSDLLSGTSESTLFRFLDRGLSRAMSKIWVIASAADKVGTSIAYDIAMLARQIGASNISRLSLLMLLQDATTGKEFDHSERMGRVFASLDELERLGRNQAIRIRFSSFNSALRYEYHQTLFDDIFVANSNEKLMAKPGQPSPVLLAMGDFLLASLSPGFNKNLFAWLPHQAAVDRVAFTSIGIHSLRVPRQALLQVLKARLIHELVLQIKRTLGGESPSPNSRGQVLRWLEGQGKNAPVDPLLTAVAKIISNPIFPVGTPNSLESVKKLTTTLPSFIAGILNSEIEIIESDNSTGRLGRAIRFLEELDRVFDVAWRKFSAQSQRTIQDCRLVVQNLLRDLKSWQNLWSLSGILASTDDLLRQARAEYSSECKGGGSHTSVLDSKAEEENFANYFLFTSSVQESTLKKMLSYIGWYWIFDPDYQHDKIMLTILLSGKRTFISWSSPEQILHAMEQLVESFLDVITNSITLDNELKKVLNRSKQDFQKLLADLVEKSAPTVKYDMYKPSVVQYTPVVSAQKRTFLVGGDENAVQFIKDHLADTDMLSLQSILPNLVLSEGKDAETVSMIQVIGQLPLESMSIFQDEVARSYYLPTDSRYHVFDAECLISRAKLRRALARSKGEFIFDIESRAMFDNGEMIELFVCSAVLSLIHEDQGKLIFELENGKSATLVETIDWFEAFKVFVHLWPFQEKSLFGPTQRLKTIQALDRNLQTRKTEWQSLYKHFYDTNILHLKESANIQHQGLAWILDAVLAELNEQFGIREK